MSFKPLNSKCPPKLHATKHRSRDVGSGIADLLSAVAHVHT